MRGVYAYDCHGRQETASDPLKLDCKKPALVLGAEYQFYKKILLTIELHLQLYVKIIYGFI